jgi:hypothetical protein
MAKSKATNNDRAGVLFAVLAVALVAFMACFVPLGPYKDYQKSERERQDLEKQLDMAVETKAEEEQIVRQQEKLMDRIRGRDPGFDLSTFLIKELAALNMKERAEVKTLKPDSLRFVENTENINVIQLRLTGVRLRELVDFLHRVYSSSNLIVMHRLDSIQAGAENTGLDCNLVFVAPKA